MNGTIYVSRTLLQLRRSLSQQNDLYLARGFSGACKTERSVFGTRFSGGLQCTYIVVTISDT